MVLWLFLSPSLEEAHPETSAKYYRSSNYVALLHGTRWLSVPRNQHVIGSHARCPSCHWSPSVARTNEDQRKSAIKVELIDGVWNGV